MRNSAVTGITVLGRKQIANKYNKSVSDGDKWCRGITKDSIFPYWAQWHDCDHQAQTDTFGKEEHKSLCPHVEDHDKIVLH